MEAPLQYRISREDARELLNRGPRLAADARRHCRRTTRGLSQLGPLLGDGVAPPPWDPADPTPADVEAFLAGTLSPDRMVAGWRIVAGWLSRHQLPCLPDVGVPVSLDLGLRSLTGLTVRCQRHLDGSLTVSLLSA